MSSFRFRLMLSGVSDITPELSDRIFEATGGDIEFQMRDGFAWLEFERRGDSLRDTIMGAIDQVERSGTGLRVLRVESDEANTIARINTDLFGVTA